jgi:tRNA nucleotidyltransferase (CCA-adding enzyme)
MILPKGVEFIIERLENNNHRADIVGGCVRDFLLLKEPNDYDVTTDATPDELREIFADVKTIDTGIKHGTLTVIFEKIPYEITTYRLDGEYSDNRHPDSVSFTRRLSDDLSRRDFTVNAMCYNHKDGLTDLFSGKEDLENRVIRAVGNPEKRFTEDALRILRALRFAATLDFTIEPETSLAIRKTAHLLEHVSKERIYTEWKKLISGMGAYKILSEYADVIAVIIPELSGLKLPEKPLFDEAEGTIRELSLFALTNKNEAPDSFLSAMMALKSDNRHRNFGKLVLETLKMKTKTRSELIRLLIAAEEDGAIGVLDLKILLGLDNRESAQALKDLLKNEVCYRISDMKISGNELLEIGIKGKSIGEMLNKLLYLIADGKLENDRERLLDFVAREVKK